jgi:P-type Ca2+ transporter type 2C
MGARRDIIAASGLAGHGEPTAPAWHALEVSHVAAMLGTDAEDGLTSAEARSRLARVGPNRVGQAREISLWRLAVSQFESLVVLLLLAAAGVAMGLGEVVEGLVILAALLLNAAIGFLTEWRARRSLARLRALVVLEARVRRDGQVTTVPAADLVPGDLVLLEAGAQVPADARLTRCTALRIDESASRSTRTRTRHSRPTLRWPSTRRWSIWAPRSSPAPVRRS